MRRDVSGLLNTYNSELIATYTKTKTNFNTINDRKYILKVVTHSKRTTYLLSHVVQMVHQLVQTEEKLHHYRSHFHVGNKPA